MKYVVSIALSIAIVINVVNTAESEFDILQEFSKLFDLIKSNDSKTEENNTSEQEHVSTMVEHTGSKNEQIELDKQQEVKGYDNKDKTKEDYGEGVVDDDEYEDYDGDEIKDRPNYDINKSPQLFEKFIKDYNKKYKNNDDRDKHYQNFVKNLKEIISINKESKSASADINQFADWSDSDFASLIG